MSSPLQQFLSLVPDILQPTVSNYWQDWCDSCEHKGLNPAVELPLMGKVWACSEFVARACIRRPEMLADLLDEGLTAERSASDYQRLVAQSIETTSTDEELMRALRQLRQQEMVRIAWRDLAGLADVEQILHELSDFAEAVVGQTLQRVYQKTTGYLGIPKNPEGVVQEMLVLAMGKLGGRELNFSSDIDLIFAYPDAGTTEGGRRLSNHEFFLRLARDLPDG